MKATCRLLVCLFVVPLASFALSAGSQEGTVVRMRMAECLESSHPLMAALSGASHQSDDEVCPEYTLISDKVIYVIVGKISGQLIPLAEHIRFRLKKNEILVRIDDENHEGRYLIRAMMLRSEWERVHADTEEQATDSTRKRLDDIIAGGELQ